MNHPETFRRSALGCAKGAFAQPYSSCPVPFSFSSAASEGLADCLCCSATQRSNSALALDRKSTRLNSSHLVISYAVFCLKKKNKNHWRIQPAEFYRLHDAEVKTFKYYL